MGGQSIPKSQSTSPAQARCVKANSLIPWHTSSPTIASWFIIPDPPILRRHAHVVWQPKKAVVIAQERNDSVGEASNGTVDATGDNDGEDARSVVTRLLPTLRKAALHLRWRQFARQAWDHQRGFNTTHAMLCLAFASNDETMEKLALDMQGMQTATQGTWKVLVRNRKAV